MRPRPFSPSTKSDSSSQTNCNSGGTGFGSGSGGGSRICKKLFVDSSSNYNGLRSTLYLKLSLPPTPATHSLLSLTPLSHILHYSTYSLPLHFSLNSSSTDALQAANILGIPLLDPDNAAETVGRAGGRKTGVPRVGGEPRDDLKLTWETGGEVRVTFGGGQPSAHRSGLKEEEQEDLDEDRVGDAGGGGNREWIVVLRLETSFGGLQWPAFANAIFLPLPPCLINTISISLTSPTDPAQNWDIATRPALRPTTTPNQHTSNSTIIGSFLSTPLLVIRWAPQVSLGEPTPRLVIQGGELDLKWTLNANGLAKLDAVVNGKISGYAGLRDKVGLELTVAGVDCESWDVDHVAGFGIEGWKVIEDDNTFTNGGSTQPRSRTISSGSSKSRSSTSSLRSSYKHSPAPTTTLTPPSSTALLVEPQLTPTPVARPKSKLRNHQTPESRPPSFTSLFETTLPILSPLDSDVTKKLLTKPSLMGVSAPFDDHIRSRDEETSFLATEMSFEGDSFQQEPFPSTRSVSRNSNHSTRPNSSNTGRLQISLSFSSLLSPFHSSPGSFTTTLSLSFPSLSLSSSPSTRFRLPTFNLPNSTSLSSVISVTSQIPDSRVELMSNPRVGLRASDSPLPGVGGKARWRTERIDDDEDEQDGVEVEIVERIDSSSRATSLLVLDSDRDFLDEDEDGKGGDVEAEENVALEAPLLVQKPNGVAVLPRQLFVGVGDFTSTPPTPVTPQTPTSSVISLLTLNLSIFPAPAPSLTSTISHWKIFGKVSFDKDLEIRIGERERVSYLASDSAGKEIDKSLGGRVKEVVWKHTWEAEEESVTISLGEAMPEFFAKERSTLDDELDVKLAELKVVVNEVAGHTLEIGSEFDTIFVSPTTSTLTRYLVTSSELPFLKFSVVPVKLSPPPAQVLVEESIAEETIVEETIPPPPPLDKKSAPTLPIETLIPNPEEEEEGVFARLSAIDKHERTKIEAAPPNVNNPSGRDGILESIGVVLIVLVLLGLVGMELGRLGWFDDTSEVTNAVENITTLTNTITVTVDHFPSPTIMSPSEETLSNSPLAKTLLQEIAAIEPAGVEDNSAIEAVTRLGVDHHAIVMFMRVIALSGKEIFEAVWRFVKFW